MKNALNTLSQDLQNKMKDYKVTFVALDEYNELNTVSEYDMDPSFYEAIEAELLANKANVFFSWNTKKVSNGFVAFVTKNTPLTVVNEKGNYCNTEVLRNDLLPTRARAKAHAQKWCKYLKQTA